MQNISQYNVIKDCFSKILIISDIKAKKLIKETKIDCSIC